MMASDLGGLDENWMRRALDLAVQGEEADEVPVGAVIVRQGRIIAAAHNQRETLRDPTAHAEMIAITQAAEAMGDWRLEECTLYVTLEPCPMCAGGIVLARIPRVVYAATDPKGGGVRSLYRILEDPRLNHRVEVRGGVLEVEAGGLLTAFFRRQRALGKK